MPEKIRGYAAEIALALAAVAFSGMGIFLIQWGTAQADVSTLKGRVENHQRILEDNERRMDEIMKDIHEIDKRGERVEVMLEGIAGQLGVPRPPRRTPPPER